MCAVRLALRVPAGAMTAVTAADRRRRRRSLASGRPGHRCRGRARGIADSDERHRPCGGVAGRDFCRGSEIRVSPKRSSGIMQKGVERERRGGGGALGGGWWKDWKWVEQVRYQEKQIIFVRKSVSDDRGSETRRKGKNRGEECGIHVKWAGGYGSGECSKQARERERSLCLRKE